MYELRSWIYFWPTSICNPAMQRSASFSRKTDFHSISAVWGGLWMDMGMGDSQVSSRGTQKMPVQCLPPMGVNVFNSCPFYQRHSHFSWPSRGRWSRAGPVGPRQEQGGRGACPLLYLQGRGQPQELFVQLIKTVNHNPFQKCCSLSQSKMRQPISLSKEVYLKAIHFLPRSRT